MNEIQLIQRARLLIEQNRPQQADELLRQALAMSPDFGMAHSLLAICLLQEEDRMREATEEAEQGIHFAPDDDFSFYVHALILDKRNRIDEAIQSIRQAIALDPSAASAHGLLAQLMTRKNRWHEVLKAAETGLQHDPEDETCRAFRSLALERLGRVEDALDEANRSIEKNPDSAFAHASRGHALLNAGKHKEAQIAFREALRLEPSNEFARSGMVQSLNANNFFFRKFLAAMSWLSRLSPQIQFAIVIGMWLGINALNSYSSANPWIRPYVLPITLLYILFALMTWIANPLFNTFLRFHPFGKHLLTTKEKWASNAIATAFVVGLVHAGFFLALMVFSGEFSSWPVCVVLLFGSMLLTAPLSVAFETEPGWPTKVAVTCAIGFSVLFLIICYAFSYGAIITPAFVKEYGGSLLSIYQFGILIFCFAGGHLRNATAKH